MFEKQDQPTPPIVSLVYDKGDLIIKEGDYGISLYKIMKGSVRVTTRSGPQEILLATLGKGEIVGEISFLNKNISPRSASVRAALKTEVQVWHPLDLQKEYEETSPIIQYISHEMLNRCLRMNRLITQMSPIKLDKSVQNKVNKNSKRVHYRKEASLPCIYRPIDASPKLRLEGMIRDISLTGANMEVRSRTIANFSHDPGEELVMEVNMPNGKTVHLSARIMSSRKPRVAGMLSFGMVFTELREGSKKELGFFLMP